MNIQATPNLWMRRECISGYSYSVEPVAYFLQDGERIRPVGMVEANKRANHQDGDMRLYPYHTCEVALLRAGSIIEAAEQFRPERCKECRQDWLVDRDGGAEWQRLVIQRHDSKCRNRHNN